MYKMFDKFVKKPAQPSDFEQVNSQSGQGNSAFVGINIEATEGSYQSFPNRLIEASPARNNGLERLYDHYIKELNGNPIPFAKSDKVGLFLELLGGTGGIYAWPPAWDYAKNMAAWQAYSFVITNPLSNVLFLIKATDDLFDTLKLESGTPAAIKDLINAPTSCELVGKYIKLGVGSIVCVIPFGIAVAMFPLPGCDQEACLALTITHSVITNTILHAVSWGLILSPEFWYYRIPFLPFEKLYSLMKTACTSAASAELIRINKERQDIYNGYRDSVTRVFSATSEHLVQRFLSKLDASEEELRAISNEDMSLAKFAELAVKYNLFPDPTAAEPSCLRRTFSRINGFLSNGPVGFLGGGVMLIGCIGWIANPFYVGLLEQLNLAATIAAGSLPAYSTAVLCAFYGAFVFNQIYSYMTTWESIRGKFSYEAQMFPKTFALFFLVNLYISYFAYASGHQLITTVFADAMWDDIRPVLQEIAKPTLQLLSFIPLLGLFNVVVRKSVAKFGSEENDNTLAARLLLKVPAMTHYIKQMKGDDLMDSIEQFSAEQQKALGIDAIKLNNDLVLLNGLDQQEIALDDVILESRVHRSRRGRFFVPHVPQAATETTSLLSKI